MLTGIIDLTALLEYLELAGCRYCFQQYSAAIIEKKNNIRIIGTV